MKIRNERGYALEIAASGQIVEPGETAEVDDVLGASLIEQPDNWKPEGAADAAKAVKAAKAAAAKAKREAKAAAKTDAAEPAIDEQDPPDDNAGAKPEDEEQDA